MPKNVYLEVGAYSLFWVDKFYNSHKDENWHFELFEPNPICIAHIEQEIKKSTVPNMNLNRVAATAENGKRKFYLGGNRRLQSSASLFCGKRYIAEDKFVEVDCIDFNQWIIDNLDKNDNIHLNMDIEGAEYEVLPKMIDGGSIYYINSVEIEFHANKFRRGSENREKFYKIHAELKLFFDTFDVPKNLWKL